ADERRVRHQLQAQLERRLPTRQARLGEPWRAPRRRRETLVPPSRGAAARDHDACRRRREVGDQLPVLVENLGAEGNTHLDRFARGAVFQGTAARLAVPGLEPAAGAIGGEIAQVGIGDEDDVAPGAAVTTVGTTLRDVLLTAEVQAAVAAATRLHADA